MNNKLLLLFAFTILFVNVHAQRNCSTNAYLQKQLLQNPDQLQKMKDIEKHTQEFLKNPKKQNQLVTIPVVFHIIYNNNSENISDAQIQSQLDVLNEDFRRTNPDADNTWSQAADTEIQFCLATVDPNGNATTGITRTQTNVTSFGTNDAMKFTSQGGRNAWPRGQYMNYWVCDLGGGILGYAQFPGGPASTDGIVGDYAYTGRGGSAQAPYDLGRTGTHEVGHWLNLRHIWGDGGCGVDDGISDTPLAGSANYSCSGSSCGSTDMVQNYMDYTDDGCMNLFTLGQKNRMQALFNPGGFRASLLNAQVCGVSCAPAGTPCNDNDPNTINDVEDGQCNCAGTALITPDICLWMEGPYKASTNNMVTTLNQLNLLPSAQPYNKAPWNYSGSESVGSFTNQTVDWVKVSFRTSTLKSSEVVATAALLMEDGCLMFPDPDFLPESLGSSFYIVVEHRNHIGIMTPTAINVSGGMLTYDFRSGDSYTNGGQGQKEVSPGVWAMFSGDGDQLQDVNGFDINGTDNTSWAPKNGEFNAYIFADYNMDGDVSGADKILWSINNGVFSLLDR